MTECRTLVDTKVRTKPVLYLPQDFAEPAEVAALETKCGVKVERLPVKIERLGQNLNLPEGLLYLPHPYVVPGGRFNEMYGWDSYFILLGLLEDGRVDLARGMVENFFFEIEHYGGLLNANRTYYLTRSQPPFLSSMIRDVYDAEVARGTQGGGEGVAGAGVSAGGEGSFAVDERGASGGGYGTGAVLRLRGGSGAGDGGR